VTVVGVQDVRNRMHQVTEIVVDLSGPVNSAQADDMATYLLAGANAKGSFTARNSPVIRLRSAVFDPANDTITLTPRKAFALNTPVQLTINGSSPSGLQDTAGQLIDGDGNGAAGGNAVAVIRRTGVTLNPVAAAVSRPSRRASSAGSIVSRPAPSTPPVMSIPPLPVMPVGSNPTLPMGSVPPSTIAPPVPTPPVVSQPISFPGY
jgi:hypothetical protein